MAETVKLADEATADLPEGFKMTELGAVPQDWQVVCLREVVAFERGVSWSKVDEAASGTGVLSIPNIKGNGLLDLTPRARIIKYIPPEKFLRIGDVLLVGSSGSIQNVGRLGVVNGSSGEPLTFASFTIRARARDSRLEQGFLVFLLRSPWVDFSTLVKRAADGKYNLQVQLLRNHMVPLPPLFEQRAIAHVLRTVQWAKETTGNVIAAARELKKSLMRYLFTYGPVPVEEAERVSLKEAEIGPIPEHWQVVHLGDVVKIRRELVDPAHCSRDLRYVGLEHIDSGSITLRRWGFASDVKSSKAKFYPGDVLYGKLRPYLDKAALAEFDGICSTDILVFQCIEVDSCYLAHYAHTASFINYAVSTTSGTNHPRTSWGALSKMKLPLPPLREQREIAMILNLIDKKMQVEEVRKKSLSALFNVLLHRLMTGMIRVKDLPFPETKGVSSDDSRE